MFATARRCSNMLILSEKDVRKCLSMKDCIEINRKALASLAKKNLPSDGGKAVVPSRLALPYSRNCNAATSASSSDPQDWSLFKPAAYYSSNNTEMGMKVVSTRANNPSMGLPTVPATVMLVDADTGIVEAVLGGTYLTAARTAAGSALATEICCSKNPSTYERLTVFGAGLQAETHIDAIRCVLPSIKHITIVNRSKGRAENLKEKLETSDTTKSLVSIEVVLLENIDKVRDAVSSSNIIATTTNTPTPLFDGSWLTSGCHINGVGSYTGDMQEVDNNTINRCRVLIDTMEALDVGDLKFMNTKSHKWDLLGDVLVNDREWRESGLEHPSSCTFFKSVGTAIQDVLTARLVVNKAKELGIGQLVDTS